MLQDNDRFIQQTITAIAIHKTCCAHYDTCNYISMRVKARVQPTSHVA